VVLARLRPTLGAVLGPGEQVGAVVVQRVIPRGPGDLAGLVEGDQVVAIEGRVVRSVYQAGALLRKHLPGEAITLTCRSPVPIADAGSTRAAEGAAAEALHGAEAEGSLVRLVEVTLGAQSDDGTLSLPTDVQQQAIKARLATPAHIEVSNAARSYQFPVSPPPAAAQARFRAAGTGPANALDEQLAQYEEVIDLLRREAASQREQLERREKLVEGLLEELRRLRQEVRELEAEEND
jgi:hypothetical protein